VEAPGVPKIIVAEDAVATEGNSVHAVQHFRARRSRISGEGAVLDDEGGVVEGDVLDDGGAGPGAVIEVGSRVVDVNLCVVSADGGATARINIYIRQHIVSAQADEVEAAPIAAPRISSD